MAFRSPIKWTHCTCNFWIGCSEVSRACDNCYARQLSVWRGWAKWGNHPRQQTQYWMADPLAWNRKAQLTGIRLRVFTNSLSDFFDNQVDDRWRADAWDIIRQTTSLDWLVLTKRPQNIGRMLPPDWGTGWDHVWLGATVEDMIEAHRRIPHLLAVPAKTRFLSGEPMLEPLNLTPWLATRDLHWVILGGESGSKRRPTFPDWMRDTRDQCVWLGVPVFVKQMCGGETVPIPADLQVWEYPQ